MEVMIPSLGMEKATLNIAVVSIVPPAMFTPGIESPNPTSVVVPSSPPKTVVKIASVPEAKGMMAP